MTILDLINGLKEKYGKNDLLGASELWNEFLWETFPKINWISYKLMSETYGKIGRLLKISEDMEMSRFFIQTADQVNVAAMCIEQGFSFKETKEVLLSKMH